MALWQQGGILTHCGLGTPYGDHSGLNTWLQWIGQRKLQDQTGKFKFLDLVWLILEV